MTARADLLGIDWAECRHGGPLAALEARGYPAGTRLDHWLTRQKEATR
jgi:hypothetical protein